MQEPRLIKTVTGTNCSHCGHDLFVCFSFVAPTLNWVITAEEMKQNKEKLKEILKSAIFKGGKESEEKIMEYIDSEECVLGAEDVNDMARELAQE